MEPLHIKSKKDSPEIVLDPQSGNFSIVGVSHPENVTSFYEPVIKWLTQFKLEIQKNGAKSVKPINFRLFFKYINSASYKYMITLFQHMQEIYEMGVPIQIVWNYEPGDEDMAESGWELIEYSGIKTPSVCEVCNDPI
ncbi:MAG TPA: DUF1987 domain-containing protein [Bacteroidales bacterium]|nr:DUF1987 domain-containing protein [Bacteroidales bacterium]